MKQKWEGYGYDVSAIKQIDLHKDSVLRDIIEEITIEVAELGWRGDTNALAKRVNTILKKKNSISVREGRMLASLASKAKEEDNRIDFSQLTYYFPGKSCVFLKKHYYSMRSNKI